MEHLALYRKYRSKTFDEIIGQKHITQTLINQINKGEISHSYLFTGTRGTGKTSIAKIFAKAINCPHPVNGSPCNKCDVCKALSDNSGIDIVEMDAASNNSVDDIRDIRDKVKYPPVNGKYKVYIIDEVHMLTPSAFNALLKTLEEPPSFVVFILATTEIQKIPATILSRCMRFDFKLVSELELGEHLKRIFKDSKITYEDEAITLIARLGQGSVRDMLSIADMCVAFSNGNVTYESVIEAIGVTDKDVLADITSCIISKDTKGILTAVDNSSKSGKNMAQLAKDLVQYIRDITVVKTCANHKDILAYPEGELSKLRDLASRTTIDRLLYYLKSLNSLEQEFRYTLNARELLEIVLLGLVVDEADEISKLKAKVKELEEKINTMVHPWKVW